MADLSPAHRAARRQGAGERKGESSVLSACVPEEDEVGRATRNPHNQITHCDLPVWLPQLRRESLQSRHHRSRRVGCASRMIHSAW